MRPGDPPSPPKFKCRGPVRHYLELLVELQDESPDGDLSEQLTSSGWCTRKSTTTCGMSRLFTRGAARAVSPGNWI